LLFNIKTEFVGNIMQNTLHTTRRIACVLIGLILTINTVVLAFYSNMNLGLIATFLLGAVLLLCGVFHNTIVTRIPKWLKYLFLFGILLVILSITFLFVYGVSDTATYQEDAVIVLGSGIKGERLSAGLKSRLDCAVAYYNKNPNAVIVLSGGQGPQENITESLAMERYMLSKGIPQEQIIKEENATSTYENFTFSKKLLDEHFQSTYNVVFITNEYHVFRAESLAKNAGFTNISNCHSKTQWYTVIPSCLRECIGVLKYWLFKN
jgi:uncharacterized SAM-binding protein YcdF (DUF218 family)